MQNNAKVGGVLSIVSGSLGVLSLLFFIGIAVMMLFMTGRFGQDFFYDSGFYDSGAPEGLFAMMAAMYIIIGICHALVGALAIAGGVFALRKMHWGWALAGAIAGAIVFLPCGVPAIVFIAMGKPEFQGVVPAVPPAPMEKIVG